MPKAISLLLNSAHPAFFLFGISDKTQQEQRVQGTTMTDKKSLSTQQEPGSMISQ